VVVKSAPQLPYLALRRSFAGMDDAIATLREVVREGVRRIPHAIRENPPHPCFRLKQAEEYEERRDGIVSSLECSSHVHGHLRALRCVYEHEVVEVVACQEECLSHHALVILRKYCQAFWVPRPEHIRE
jgi:hypothetical protein